MKTLIHFICFTLLTITTTCQSKTNETNTQKADKTEFAENISRKLLEAQKKGEFYELTDTEASPMMVSNLNEDLQKSSYNQIKNMFGDFKDLKFEALVKHNIDNETYEIYRFKGDFEKSNNVEIRAVLNQSGKLAGFFIKPWNDTL